MIGDIAAKPTRRVFGTGARDGVGRKGGMGVERGRPQRFARRRVGRAMTPTPRSHGEATPPSVHWRRMASRGCKRGRYQGVKDVVAFSRGVRPVDRRRYSLAFSGSSKKSGTTVSDLVRLPHQVSPTADGRVMDGSVEEPVWPVGLDGLEPSSGNRCVADDEALFGRSDS
jgi:hypothetical protein